MTSPPFFWVWKLWNTPCPRTAVWNVFFKGVPLLTMIACCHCDIEFIDKRTNQLERRCPRPRAAVAARRITGGVEITIKTEHNRDVFVSKEPVVFDKFSGEGKLTVKIPEYLNILLIRNAAVDEIQKLLRVIRPEVVVGTLESNKENISSNTKSIEAGVKPLSNQRKLSTPESKKNARTTKGSLSPFLSMLLSKVVKGADKPDVSRTDACSAISKTPIKRRLLTCGGNSPTMTRMGGPTDSSNAWKSPSPRMARKQGRFMQSPQLVRLRKSPVKVSKPLNFAMAGGKDAEILTDEQEEVLGACLKGDCVFFTGGAGTGKSTLLGSVVKTLEEKHGKANVFVTATTGLAACIIEGTTVHQFAGINGGACEDGASSDHSATVKSILQRPQVVRRLRSASVLVIDEISMMSADLFELLDQILQGARASNKPMGGLQVVLSGDFFQLPPVAKSGGAVSESVSTCRQWLSAGASSAFGSQGVSSTQGGGGIQPVSVNAQGYVTFSRVASQGASMSQFDGVMPTQSTYGTYSSSQQPLMQTQAQSRPVSSNGTGNSSTCTGSNNSAPKVRFCFQSPVWDRLVQSSFVLTKVFRQRESSFVTLLNDIRWGNFKDETRRSFQPCVGRKLDSSDGILPTRIFTHRKDVDTLNAKELQQLRGDSVEYKAVDSGEPQYLRSLQMNCPAKQILKLKVGAQVILVKTIDAKEGLVNGARGVVMKFTRDTKRPVVRFSDGVERSLSCESFSISMGGRVVAQRSQIPLDLAWGISVHKSQGMTVDRAILHLRKVFEFGQSYVALSRVRSIEGLSLDSALTAVQVKAHPDVIKFYQELTQKQQLRARGQTKDSRAHSLR